MTGADDNAAIAGLFTIGCLLVAGFLACAVSELVAFHRRGMDRLRKGKR